MHDSAATAKGTAKIRPLTADDLNVVRELLSRRDARAWDDASTAWFVHQLNPAKCQAWAAFDGQQPVGLTTIFLRRLRMRGEPRPVAYWANLYVDPAYRDQMLYPRLPMAMLNSLKSLGIELIYAPVRIPQLAKAHLGLGFANIGSMEVLVRPLRPGRFIAKYKKLGAAAQVVAVPADALFSVALALRSVKGRAGAHVNSCGVRDAPLQEISELIERRDGEGISQAWTGAALRDRYSQTREGGEYSFVTVRNSQTLSAVAIYRVAERGDGIRVGVLMDLAFYEGAEVDAALALRRIEQASLAAGCELLIYLDGLGQCNRSLLLQCGFRKSPEVYELLVWPKKLAAGDEWLGDRSRWKFGFRDHDAF